MTSEGSYKLHWNQRIALVRHSLHASRRTNDFSFFKTLQAHALIEGTDHVAVLYSLLGDNADSVLSTLDNLNAGIAYVHQDAFKAVYDGAKAAMNDHNQSLSDRRCLLRVDIGQQRDMADHSIDKTTNSVINLIQAQPAHCQEAVANAWITGTTIISDAVSVCLNEMKQLEDGLDDFIRLEYSWNCIQSSVDAAISALRGIFSLMAPNVENGFCFRREPSASANSDHGGASAIRSRQSSTALAFGFIKKALSHSQLQPPSASKQGHSNPISLSVSPPEANARGFRASMSAACPTRMSTFSNHPHTVLTTIPPTPAVVDVSSSQRDGMVSPFNPKADYFAFDMEKAIEQEKERDSTDDPML
jgi:hypothetical protein